MDRFRLPSTRIGETGDPVALLDGIFAHAPVAFQIYRADGQSLLVNAAFLELFGAEPPPEYNVFKDEILEKQGFLQLVRRAFAGETVQVPPLWYDPRELRQVVVKDAHRVAIQVTLFPLADRDGAVGHVAVCIRDVTSEQELKRATEELGISAARYRAQFESAPEAIVTLDVDRGTFVEVNEKAVRLFGRSREELFGLNPVDVSPPNQPDGTPSAQAAHGYIAAALRDERPVFEWIHRNAAGDDIPCEVRLVRLPDNKLNLCRGSIIDVSDRKRAEAERQRLEDVLERTQEQLRQAQKMEAIGRLAGGVAHDFNNLLSVILGYTQLLFTSPEVGPNAVSDLREINSAAERAAVLTSALLAFSRQQVLELAVVDLNEIVIRMDKMLRRVIGEDIVLRLATDPRMGAVKVDPGQVEQVIINLAVNARDAMPQGGVLTIETANVDLDEDYAQGHAGVVAGPHVMLAISDTGVGIPKGLQSKVFEPFFTTKERGKGTGLGLSTVFGIVQQSGGHIWLYSEPGRGTTFKIYFPRSDQQSVTNVSEIPAILAPTTRGSETILLVEDEDQLRVLGNTILTKNGYSVIVAANPLDALARCEQFEGTIHLLVTDVVMPHMNGRELAERIARLRPDTKLLYVSGYTDNTIVHHGVLDGGIAFLQKPITPDVFLRKVREVLDADAARGR